jgi:hypothetical protein
MVKMIRILEVPIYLLVIALCCIENGSTNVGIILMITSACRLWVNHITDSSIYKSKGE